MWLYVDKTFILQTKQRNLSVCEDWKIIVLLPAVKIQILDKPFYFIFSRAQQQLHLNHNNHLTFQFTFCFQFSTLISSSWEIDIDAEINVPEGAKV